MTADLFSILTYSSIHGHSVLSTYVMYIYREITCQEIFLAEDVRAFTIFFLPSLFIFIISHQYIFICTNKYRMAGRARLPKVIRRKVQVFVRNFVLFGLTYLTVYLMVTSYSEFSNRRDVLKLYGFVPGIV